MNRRIQTAVALRFSAIEMSALCVGIMVAVALANPQRGAVVAIIAALVSSAICFAYGHYARHAEHGEGKLAFAAVRIWLILSLAWLPLAL